MNIGLLSSEKNGKLEVAPSDLSSQVPIENTKAWLWANKDLLISTGLLTEEYFSKEDHTDNYLILVIPCSYIVDKNAVEDEIDRLKGSI